MRIAICEDDKREALQIAEYIKQHPNTKSFEVYYSADNLLANYSKGKRHDLVFMDIQMSGLNGFKAAKEIKKMCSNNRPLITFATSTAGYAPLGYRLAWDYLIKPIDRKKVHNCIDNAVEELHKHIFQIKTVDSVMNINAKNIIYFEVNQGVVTIHAKNDTKYVARAALSAVIEKLPLKRNFAQPHRCFCVNLELVKGYTDKIITMSNNDEIPIGKNKKVEFLQAHMAFLGGGDCKHD